MIGAVGGGRSGAGGCVGESSVGVGTLESLDSSEQATQLQGVGEGVGEAVLHVEVAYAKEVHLDGLGL